jgi:alpha-beta hydrolase superfamily lysophospholipase
MDTVSEAAEAHDVAKVEVFTASDGYAHHYFHYVPTNPVQAALVCLSGIKSHAGWYDHSCCQLCAAGYEVFFLDRRGSGRNQPARGDTPSFRRLLKDIAEFVQSDSVARSGRPVFLQSVSWGSKLALGFQKRHPGLIDGLIFICPGWFPRIKLSFLAQLQVLGARLVTPNRSFPIPLQDPELFTSTPRWLDYLRSDSLSLDYATARFMVESSRLDFYLRSVHRYITIPTLLMLAGHDRIVDNVATHRFFHRLPTFDKNVITYAEAHHTLEFEPDPSWIIAEIVRWLDRQCQRPALKADR